MTTIDSGESFVAFTAGEDVRQEREESLSPLDDLISALIEYHKPDLDAMEEKLLERLPLRCRARRCLKKLEPDERTSLETILTTAVRYVFLSYPPVDAICWISKHSQAVKLANAKDPESRLNRYSTNIRMVAEYLVESYDISTPEVITQTYSTTTPHLSLRGA